MADFKYIDSVSDSVYDAISSGEYDIDFSQFEDRDECIQWLADYFVDEDSVTGAGSGSFTMNRNEAKQNIFDDSFCVADVIRDNDLDGKFIADAFDGDWEKLDVFCRQGVLMQAVEIAMDALVSDGDESVVALTFEW